MAGSSSGHCFPLLEKVNEMTESHRLTVLKALYFPTLRPAVVGSAICSICLFSIYYTCNVKQFKKKSRHLISVHFSSNTVPTLDPFYPVTAY